MPALARIVQGPVELEIRAGAVDDLPKLLADSRVSATGDVAVVVGHGIGQRIAEQLRTTLPGVPVHAVDGATLDNATELVAKLRAEGFHDAIVGIGGGQTLDLAKYAASMLGLPFVACATTLAHDGIASPVAVLSSGERKMSFGVHVPIAVLVDLDFVRTSPEHHIRSGIGDTLSNLSAIADWELAHRVNDEPIDQFAVALARGAATAVLWRSDDMLGDPFLTGLAEALVLSGMAMSVAGSSRPCSGAEHEISHAIDALHGTTTLHGAQVGVGTLFATWLREDPRFEQFDRTFRHYGLERSPQELGLTAEQFTEAVAYAPQTRPGRFTLLEHLDLDRATIRERVDAYVDALGR